MAIEQENMIYIYEDDDEDDYDGGILMICFYLGKKSNQAWGNHKN